MNSFMCTLSQQKALVVIFFLSIVFGLLNFSFFSIIPSLDDVRVWAGFFCFYFFSLLLKEKKCILNELCQFIKILFYLDLATNFLLLFGFSVPWAELPMVRPGDMFPRFPGVKNSALFSGYLSLLYSVVLMVEYPKITKHNFIFYILLLINILLAGSYRFFIILLFLFIVKHYKLYECRLKVLYSFIVMVVVVVLSTFLTQNISGSNSIRARLWKNAISSVFDANNCIGHGFFVPKVPEGATGFLKLQAAGVTESTILQWGICFGYIIMILLLLYFIKVFLKISNYTTFTLETGFFLIEISLWFFGGGIGNILNITLLSLSIANIINHDINNHTDI